MVVPPLLKILGSEEAFVKILQKVRWSKGVQCVYCESKEVIRF